MQPRLDLWIGLAVIALACKRKGEPETPAMSLAEARKAAEPVYVELTTIANNLPEIETLKPTKCPARPKAMGMVLGPKLLAIAGKPTTPLDPWLRGPMEMGSGSLRQLPPKSETSENPDDYAAPAKEFATLSHLMVWWVEESAAPQTNGGADFVPGFAIGWLIVFDLSTHAPVCSWPIAVGSSEKVTYAVGRKPEAIEVELSQKNATSVDLIGQFNGAMHRAKQAMGI